MVSALVEQRDRKEGARTMKKNIHGINVRTHLKAGGWVYNLNEALV